MVIREINNKNGGGDENWYLIIYNKNVYLFNPHKCQHTHTHTHTIYNIFCIYQYHPIEAVLLIYWIHVDKNRI